MLRIALSAVLGGTLMAGFAHAQPSSYFGFGDTTPRPPASVPNGSLPPQQPQQYPPQQPPAQYPNPSQPALPGQAAVPPGTGPAPSGIQAQPLPPPPGGAQSPPGAQRARVGPPTPGAPGAPGTGPAPSDVPPPPSAAQPDDAVVTEMPTQKIENTRAVFAGLDKITGRTISFDAAVGETVQFGALRVSARVCYTRPPTEATNTDAFVEVDEVTLQGEIKRIFNGWMFASSPGLHGVEHPIYDIWLTDCSAPTRVAEPVVQPPPTPAAAQAPPRPPKPKPPPRTQPPPTAAAPGQLPPPQPR
jgi:hypothetical protein